MSTERLEEQVEAELQEDPGWEEIAHDAFESIIGGAPPHNGTFQPE